MTKAANNIETKCFEIKAKNGSSLVVSNYGARMVALHVPNKNGEFQNIILGFKDLNLYENKSVEYFGAFIAPFANRIKDASFSIGENEYKFSPNENKHLLHSGVFGLHQSTWKIEKRLDDLVEMSCDSKEYENGYPGNPHFTVRYGFDKKSNLEMSVSCSTDSDTHINATFHPYFNLTGFDNNIEDHYLTLNADQFLPVDKELIPTGEWRNAKNTIFDFTEEKKIRNNLYINDDQLDSGGGFDHCFVINEGRKPAAEVWSKESGIRMKLFTTEPGIQFYSGNYDDFEVGDLSFVKRGALCLEPQRFPNAPNQNSFPSTLLKKNDVYHSKTRLEFTIDNT